jgi:hypothetical protein
MKNFRIIPLVLVAMAITFSMCSKDDEVTPNNPEAQPYEGSWETAEFQNLVGGSVVMQKMDFDFTDTTFITQVFTIVSDVEAPSLGVKGDVTPKTENNIHISITDLGLPNQSGNYDWKNRVNDAVEYQQIYQGFVAAFMPEDFDAMHEIEGDLFDLVIPVAQDTIHLYKR